MTRPSRIPKHRPSAQQGIKSLRGYRRVVDFALECAMSGIISAREAKALAETAKVGSEMYLAEHQLAAHLADQEPQDHPLGHDGGAEPVPLDEMAEARALDNVGYETVVPAPEGQAVLDAQAASMVGGPKVPTSDLNPYPSPKGQKNHPAPVPKDYSDIDIEV